MRNMLKLVVWTPKWEYTAVYIWRMKDKYRNVYASDGKFVNSLGDIYKLGPHDTERTIENPWKDDEY